MNASVKFFANYSCSLGLPQKSTATVREQKLKQQINLLILRGFHYCCSVSRRVSGRVAGKHDKNRKCARLKLRINYSANHHQSQERRNHEIKGKVQRVRQTRGLNNVLPSHPHELSWVEPYALMLLPFTYSSVKLRINSMFNTRPRLVFTMKVGTPASSTTVDNQRLLLGVAGCGNIPGNVLGEPIFQDKIFNPTLFTSSNIH